MKPPSEDVLRDDYARTLDVFKALVDVRFRLLVLMPAAAAVTTGLLGGARNDPAGAAAGRLPLSVLGLVVTAGLIVYEIRNSQLHDAVVHRLRFLEEMLGLPPSTNRAPGGVMNERPPRPQLFGFLELWHDLALSIVYGTSIGAWTWLLLSSTSPLPDLLCTNGRPNNWYFWPACWSYTPPLFALVGGVLAGRVVIAMTRVNRPSPGYAPLLLVPPPNAVPLVKTVLDRFDKPRQNRATLTQGEAELTCFLGLAAQNDLRGIVFPRNLRYILRKNGRKLLRNEGERRSRTWVQTTKKGEAHRANDETARKKELADILTKRVYFYQEVSDSAENSAETLRAALLSKKGVFAPWLDADPVEYRIRWRDQLKVPAASP